MKRGRWDVDILSEASSDDDMSSSSTKCLCIPVNPLAAPTHYHRNSNRGSGSRDAGAPSILSAHPGSMDRRRVPMPAPTSSASSFAGSGDSVVTSDETATTIQKDPSLADGEKMLADELSNMTLNERETVLDDIHGVKSTMKETDELHAFGMQMLDNQIGKIEREKKEMYLRVNFLAPKLARDEKLKLLYLRSSNWQPHIAAERYCKHFQVKQQLFGVANVCKVILWDDLSEDAQQSLLNGSFHMHEDFQDKSKRVIVVNSPSRWQYHHVLSHIQAMWYRNFSSSYSVETQRNGVIIIANFFGASSSAFSDSIQMAKYDFLDTMPIRVAGVHYLFPDTQLRPVFSFLLSAMPKSFRLRSRVHFGSMMENCYSLATYGIPMSSLPFETSGEFLLNVIHDTIEKSKLEAKAMEMEYLGLSSSSDDDNDDNNNNSTKKKIIWQVQSNDVILGRGGATRRHEGNIQFPIWVQQCITELQEDGKRLKLYETAVQVLKTKYGVRFLKRYKDDWWVEVSDSVAKERVAMCYRNLSKTNL